MSAALPELKPARAEDRRLVTGSGRYTADWNLPGQAHAFVLRSDRAHARILRCDVSAVRQAPGVLAVLTAEDAAQAGLRTIPVGAPLNGGDGQPARRAHMPMLAVDKVCFVGQPVVFVVAESALLAQDAAALADLEYEELPAVATVAAALAEGAPELHEAAPGNLSLHFDRGDAKAVDAAFARAARTSTLRVHSQRLAGNPMELRSCLADWDATRETVTVYTASQGESAMRNNLAYVTGWAPERIDIVTQDVGGSFGLRGTACPEHALSMLASRSLGRPVKWVASRSELFVGEWHGRALTLEGSVALDDEGRILALRFADETDLGAFSCYFGALIGTMNLSNTMGGVYRVPALHMRSKVVFTNTVPVSAYRGAGRPDIAYAIERLIDFAAHEHGLDPVALRRLNFVPRDAFPYTTAIGTVYDSGDFAGVLDKALALADRAGFEARRAEAAARGRLRGLGIACYLEACAGNAVSPKDQVAVQFDAEGRLQLYGTTGPSGQGHETSFTQIIADGLGLPVDGVRYRPAPRALGLAGNTTGGSRTLFGAGSAFKNLVTAIQQQALPHAAALLEVPADALRYADGGFVAPDGRRLSLIEFARRLAGPTPHPLDCTAEHSAGPTYPNGCHIAEVEIDPDTGTTEVIRYTAVDDFGTVVSPQLVEGQVHGGLMQGAGQVFGERVVYDDDGQLLTGSFTDYVMPRIGWAFPVQMEDHPVPTRTNALGAKGVGESGTTGSLSSLSNAMVDALRPLGITAMDTPFSPARVWQAVREARAGKPGR